MGGLINLLPWREARRRQRIRLGGLLAVGVILSIIALTLSLRTLRQVEAEQRAARAQAENQIYSAFAQREGALREQLQHGEWQAQRVRRRVATQAWQPRLLALAALLPESLWLTRFDYQPQGITLSGLALNLQSVAALEKALGKLEGFLPAKAGATRRDEQGRWSFSFFLAGETGHAERR